MMVWGPGAKGPGHIFHPFTYTLPVEGEVAGLGRARKYGIPHVPFSPCDLMTRESPTVAT